MRRHAHSTPLLPVLRFPNARDFQAIIADSSRPVRAHEQWRPGWGNGGTCLGEDTDIQDFIPAGGGSLRGALRPATREPVATFTPTQTVHPDEIWHPWGGELDSRPVAPRRRTRERPR